MGSWEVLKEGTEAVILTFGTTIDMALDAADRLEKEGRSVRVVNARYIKPMDESMLHDIMKQGLPILTVEEAVLQGGFGSAVLEFAEENSYTSQWVRRMGVPDRFIEHGSVPKLWEEIGLTPDNMVKHLKELIPTKQQRA